MTHESKLATAVKSIIQLSSEEERRQMIEQSCGEDHSLRNRLKMIIDALPDDNCPAVRPSEEEGRKLTTGSEKRNSSAGKNVVNDRSVLLSLGKSIEAPQVSLQDSLHESEQPILQPASSEMPQLKPQSRYQLQGEIARGGIGAILKGRDVDLGRNLAVKVLLDEHKDKPNVLQRFIEEAQIGGQLQHPGIAPVYELGRFEDKRPFFSMKLVKGETLAYLLSGRRSPQQNHSELIGHFEQICQAVAYAHSRQVIHRDLKPANIMIGDFGEVQVMDWGLAKVLPKPGTASVQAEKSPTVPDARSVIRTVRSDGKDVPMGTLDSDQIVGSQTQLGSAMGTPAYMPPEQALGQVESMDQRSDVFGLGAILCEILTGFPPYLGATITEVLKSAAAAKLNECHQRLDHCEQDPRLVELAKTCLSARQSDRPKDAGEVVEQITQYLESVQSQLREAELLKIRETAKAEEARKRRRISIVLSSMILTVVLLGGGAALWWQRIESERAANLVMDFEETVAEAKLKQQLAEKAPLADREAIYEDALTSIDKALALAETDLIDAGKSSEVKKLKNVLSESIATSRQVLLQSASDSRLANRLLLLQVASVERRKLEAMKLDPGLIHGFATQQFQRVFATEGISLETHPSEVAVRIARSPYAAQLILSLDLWRLSEVRDNPASDAQEWLAAVLKKADKNSARHAFRFALDRGKAFSEYDLIKEIGAFNEPEDVVWYATLLKHDGQMELAANLIRPMQIQQPNNFDINLALADCLLDSEPGKAMSFARAALAKRPTSQAAVWEVGVALAELDELETCRELIRHLLADKRLSVDDRNVLTLDMLSRQNNELARVITEDTLNVQPDNEYAAKLRDVAHAASSNQRL